MPALIQRLLAAFSLRRNLRSLFTPPATAFKPVDGLRALSILWVIAYHTTAFLGAPLRQSPSEPLFRPLRRGFLGVDVFFVISGFLIAHLLLRERQARGRISFGRFYARRALRILPAYYLSLFVFCQLIGQNCDMVWTNLLYINNFVPVAKQCMSWSWSLAIEEQFYMVFPLFLVLVFRLPRCRASFLFAVLGLGVVIRGVVLFSHGLHLPSPNHDQRYSEGFYIQPHVRYGELLCGVIVAYLVVHTDAVERLRRAPGGVLIGTVLSLSCIGLMCVTRQPISQYGWPSWGNFLYFTLSGYAFTAAIAYVLFISLHGIGAGRFFGKVLGARIWYPIGQLSYSGYLLHMIVIMVGVEAGVFEPATSVPALCLRLIEVLPLSLLMAAGLYLLVERPIMNLR